MSKAIRDRIAEIQARMAVVRAGVHEKGDALTRAEDQAATTEIEDLAKQLSAAICDGADPCPNCGGMPHGIVHPMPVKRGTERPIYEVGCLPCPNIRAIDLLPELAVERWNAGEFEAPSDGPGVRLAGEGKVAE